MTIRNTALEILRNGGTALGAGVRMARTIDIGKAMKTAGFDFLFIDLEHSSISIDTAAQMAAAALDADITPLVRVPKGDLALAARMLDSGALGIVVPHIETPEEARQIVAELRLPPIGHRSYSGMNLQQEYRLASRVEAAAAVEQMTMVVVMLESPEAIAQVDAIASVEGVDALLVGTNDLCTEMGIAGEHGHPKIVQAYEQVITACQRHDKIPGAGGVDSDLMTRYIAMGARLILAGVDLGFLMQGASARVDLLRGVQEIA